MFLSVYYMKSFVLGPKDRVVNENTQELCSLELTFNVGNLKVNKSTHKKSSRSDAKWASGEERL